jgi:integrase
MATSHAQIDRLLPDKTAQSGTKYVIGPDGSRLTLADLPSPDTKRWVMRRKAEIVVAVCGGLLSLDEACSRYTLNYDEFRSWQRRLDRFGLEGLSTMRIQLYRNPVGSARARARSRSSARATAWQQRIWINELWAFQSKTILWFVCGTHSASIEILRESIISTARKSLRTAAVRRSAAMSGARYEIATAPAHLHLPLLLELWTGQRQGDLLRLAWSTYDGSAIRLRPRKTITRKRPRGKTVTVPVGAPLKAALDELAKSKKSPVILLTTEGTPWDRGGLARIVQQARDAAGIVGVTFNDLENALQNQLAGGLGFEPRFSESESDVPCFCGFPSVSASVKNADETASFFLPCVRTLPRVFSHLVARW